MNEKKEFNVEVRIYQQDWIPGFAAFANDGVIDEGKAHIVLNIGATLGAVASGDVEPSDVPYWIAENIMHEVIHACEAWAEVEFSEKKVETLLERYRQYVTEERGG